VKTTTYSALVLAAGRGADDPMVQAYGTAHKCLLDIGGTPMIMRVLNTLATAPEIDRIVISIDDLEVLHGATGFTDLARRFPVDIIASADQASSSVAQAFASGRLGFPALVTTADHALLSPGIVAEFLEGSAASRADLTVGLARDRTILDAYPQSVRTFLKFSDGRFSGCNLFAFQTEAALAAVAFWQRVERDRKQPWKLVRAFGLRPLLAYVTGNLSSERAFAGGSRKLGCTVCAVELAQADAAIDVDKPADLELVNAILNARGT